VQNVLHSAETKRLTEMQQGPRKSNESCHRLLGQAKQATSTENSHLFDQFLKVKMRIILPWRGEL
jgi:hypothetical protein